MSEDLIPVMVNVRPSDNVVSVLMLLETPIGTAIYEGDGYKRIGQVKESTWTEFDERLKVTRNRKGWTWWYDEQEWGRSTGRAKTKRAAIEAMLLAGGYVEAPPNAANPGLW